MNPKTSPWTRFADGVRAAANTIGCLAIMTGFGWFLIRLAGWPLPDHWPSRDEWIAFLNDPMYGSFLRDFGACVGWLLLLLIIVAIAVETFARITRRRWPRLRLPAPLRAFGAAIVGASVIGLITAPAHAKAATGGPAQQPPAATALATPSTALPAQATPSKAGKVTFVVRGQRYHVLVRRGDTMSAIARQWLGDANRWPEICRLNNHRHFPAAGGTLRDCDLIYPRWDLKLPADAVPPPGAVPAHAPTPKPPAVTPPASDPELPPRQPIAPTPPTPTPSPSITTPATTDPDGVVDLETGSPSSPSTPLPAVTSAPAASDAEHHNADSWLTYALAAALLGAATLVTRRRLLAHRTGPAADRGRRQRPLPYVVTLARHLARLRTTRPKPSKPSPSDSDSGATAPADSYDTGLLEPTEPAVLGLLGPGAPAAARAAIIETLSPPADDSPPGHVITTADTLQHLLDGHTVDTSGWPRLHVADNVTGALDHLHAQLLHTRHARERTPAAQAPAPRILLIIPPPPAHQTGRLQALLATADTATARVLGDWPTTHTLAADGTTGTSSPRHPVLSIPDTLDALDLVREATTGPATAPAPQTAPQSAAGPAPDEPPIDNPDTATTAPEAPTEDVGDKAALHVLGPVRFGPDRPGTRPHLRGKAKELAVYLACRPNGGDVNIICEILYPDSTVSKSLTNVQQAVTSLRKVLAYHTTRRGNPVLLTDDRYRLNPDLVDVDLWQLHHLASAAAATTDPHQRQRNLEHATSLGTADLAPELDNDWIDAYRVTTTVTIVEAHTALADMLRPADPQRAAALLATAIAIDPGNESLYRRRMRILAQLGQIDAVRATLRDLSHVLADLDAKPEPETLQLAHHLLAAAPTHSNTSRATESSKPPTQKGPVTPTARR